MRNIKFLQLRKQHKERQYQISHLPLSIIRLIILIQGKPSINLLLDILLTNLLKYVNPFFIGIFSYVLDLEIDDLHKISEVLELVNAGNHLCDFFLDFDGGHLNYFHCILITSKLVLDCENVAEEALSQVLFVDIVVDFCALAIEKFVLSLGFLWLWNC